jgi:phosphatidylinositol alpha-mannosyltransferase
MAKNNQFLKIGFVLDDSLDTADGVQQYIITVGSWLTRQGHDVHYLVGETKRSDIANLHSLSKNIKVRFNRNRMSMPLPASRKALQTLLRREAFDVLHVQVPYSPFLAGRIVQAAPSTTAIVGTFHIAPHSKTVHAANKLLSGMIQRSLKNFDGFMSVSVVAQKFAKQTFGIDSIVVPNTVDTAPYMSATALPQYKNDLTVVFLGRLVDRKGCQHLLRAVNYIQKHQLVERSYKVVICGKGPMEQQLKAYSEEHNIRTLIEFVGFVEEEEKPRYLASADIAIFPSTGGESFGIVLIEGMAAVRGALLAGNNPGYASVMSAHPETLINPNDEAAMGTAIATLLNNPGMRKAARTWQLSEVQQYDVSSVGARIVEQYNAALHKRKH